MPLQQKGVAEFNEVINHVWDTQFYSDKHGGVVNKHARQNNIVGYQEQVANIPRRKGTIVHFDNSPLLKELLEEKLHTLRTRFDKLILAEGNRYPDGGTRNHGIRWHGDGERRLVVAVRCGAVEGARSMPIYYQWYHNTKPIGELIEIPLINGDVYVKSEVAVGTDWKSHSKVTLRHATGAYKHTDVPVCRE